MNDLLRTECVKHRNDIPVQVWIQNMGQRWGDASKEAHKMLNECRRSEVGTSSQMRPEPHTPETSEQQGNGRRGVSEKTVLVCYGWQLELQTKVN